MAANVTKKREDYWNLQIHYFSKNNSNTLLQMQPRTDYNSINYNIVVPCQKLQPYIVHYWTLQIAAEVGRWHERTLPNGCVSWFFHRRNPLLFGNRSQQPQALVRGQDFSFVDVCTQGETDFIAVVFRPFAAHLFMPHSANDFSNQMIDIEQLDDKRLTILAQKIEESDSNLKAIELIETELINRLTNVKQNVASNAKRVEYAVQLINNEPSINIGRLAQQTCVSERQLRRLFAEHVGLSPQELVRVARFNQAMLLMLNNPTWAFVDIALELNYTDSAHFSHDIKQFTGCAPTQFNSKCRPYSEFFTCPTINS